MEQAQAAVFRPEVVAPLANAMRLVNRKQTQLATLMERAQKVFHSGGVDTLWRSIKHCEFCAQQLLFNLATFFKCLRRV